MNERQSTLDKYPKADDVIACAYFNDLYEEHHLLIRHIVMKKLGKAAQKMTVEDLTQETWTKIWRYVKTLDRAQNIRGYLSYVANSVCLDYWRKTCKGRELTIIDDEENGFDAIAPGDDPQAELEAKRRFEFLHGQMRNAKHQKSMRLLWDFGYLGYGYDELTTRYGLPINTVKTYLYRGRKHLAQFKAACLT